MLNSTPKNDKPVFTIFAGTNGAGKSTLTNILFNRLGVVIDADAIAKSMNPEFPDKASVAAGRRVIQLVDFCISSRINFSLETTLSGRMVTGQIKRAISQGFEVNVFFIGLESPELHIRRVYERVKRGGHHIPEDVIRRRYEKSFKGLVDITPIVDKIYLLDNTSTLPKHNMTIENGDIVFQTINPNKWVVQKVIPLLRN